MESTYFRRGFGLKAEIEGQLAADYHSAVVEALRAQQLPPRRRTADLPPGPGIRVLLRGGPGGGLRLRDPDEVPRPAALPGRRDHPQPARQPEARATWASAFLHARRGRRVRFLADLAGRRRHPAGVRRHDRRLRAAARDRLRAGGHDLRLGAQRLEAGRELRARRLHRAHPRQALPRGDQGDRQPGDEVPGRPLSRGARHGRSAAWSATTSRAGGDRGGAARSDSRRRSRRGSTSSGTWSGSGIANQTTMLSSESLAIAEEVRRSMARRYGDAAVAEHFRSFDTICSATQERQDAVVALLEEPLDVMVVVGGYNSSNTCHLAALVHSRGVRVYHIEDADCDRSRRARSATSRSAPSRKSRRDGWLGEARLIGITAGASTPNNKIGETIAQDLRDRRRGAAPAGSAYGRPVTGRTTFLDLSHTITHGMTTYPGLPGPVICDFLSREASRGKYAPGVEFQIGKIEMVANTGTYVDSPFHRYADGKDLCGLSLESLADLEILVIRAVGGRAVDRQALRGQADPGPGGAGAHRAGTGTGARSAISPATRSSPPTRRSTWWTRARPSSGSTRSTSTTSATWRARSTPRSSPPACRSSSTCAGWSSFPRRARASSRCRPRWPGSGPFRCGRSPRLKRT